MSKEPGVGHTYQPNKKGSSRFTEGNINNFAVPAVVKYGDPGVPILCTSEEDFKEKTGTLPVTGYEFEHRSIIHAFRNSVYRKYAALRLWVIPVRHYTEIDDPATLVATHSGYDVLDALSQVTFTIYDKLWGTSTLQAIVTPSESAPATLFDINIYDGSTLFDTVINCNLTKTSPNYVVRRVGTNRKWYVTDANTGVLPDTMVASESLAGGEDGLAGLVRADFVGASSAKGNTGLYAIKKLLHTIDQPEGCAIFHKFVSDEDNINTMHSIIDFGNAYAVEPIISPPFGMDEDSVYDLRYGKGDYSGYDPMGEETCGTICIWPHVSPTWLADEKDANGEPVYVDVASHKMGRMAYAAAREWLHEPAAGFEYGEGESIAHYEVETDIDTSKKLDPAGIQVFRADLGYIDGHKTLSRDPDYAAGEHIWRLDNKVIRDFETNTRRWVHRSINVTKAKALERAMRAYFRRLFEAHAEAFNFKTVEESTLVDVVGQNNFSGDDWKDGIVYTWWSVFWAPAIQRIEHRFGHLTGNALDETV